MLDGRLNDRQRRFAEENYSVLEGFLTQRGLSVPDYYDVVVFRFLKAVKQYDEREDLKRYEFSEFADKQMRSELRDHFEKVNQERADFRFLSLDYTFPGSNLTFGDVVADKSVNICDEVCEKLSRTPKRYRLLHTYPKRTVAEVTILKEVV